MDTQWAQFTNLNDMSDLDILQLCEDTSQYCKQDDLGFNSSMLDVGPHDQGLTVDTDVGEVRRLLQEISSRLENIEQKTSKLDRIDGGVAALETAMDMLGAVGNDILEGLNKMRQGLGGYLKAIVEHSSG